MKLRVGSVLIGVVIGLIIAYGLGFFESSPLPTGPRSDVVTVTGTLEVAGGIPKRIDFLGTNIASSAPVTDLRAPGTSSGTYSGRYSISIPSGVSYSISIVLESSFRGDSCDGGFFFVKSGSRTLNHDISC